MNKTYEELSDELHVCHERIAELEQAFEKQAKAATRGMDAAKMVAYQREQNASRMYAECSPQALESEREANAQLTERIAELEAQVELHKAAEEMQIALREKAGEREAALGAHVDRLRERLAMCRHHACYSIGDSGPLAIQLASIRKVANEALREEPETSLARRDEESMRKGFWWGFERARMHPDENNILAEWEDAKSLIAKNEHHRKSNEG